MKLPLAALRLIFRPTRVASIGMMLLIWVGVAGSLLAGFSTDLRNRDFYAGQAETIASSFTQADVKALNGNQNDLPLLAYESIKNRLVQSRTGNTDVSFAHLIGMRDDGSVFLYADSEPPGNANYSPPGHPYPEASEKLRNSFSGADGPFIEGLTQDRWGWWFTSYAPVKDPQNGRVLAILSIQVPASVYYFRILVYAIVPLLLAAIPLAGLMRDIRISAKEKEIIELKNQFVSIASHELRSPLNGMLWAIQSFIKTPPKGMNKEDKELLHDMYRSAASSLATVNEILDFSIFERGKADHLQRDTVDLKAVFHEVKKTLKLGASEKDIKIELGGEWPDHLFTIGDLGALKRSFMNVVSNAIKYSPEHSVVTITYKLQHGGHLFAVRDHGIGIPEEEQAKVLEGYYRATNAQKIQAHGTGLGLWLCRLVIEQHGGEVWLKSRVGQGTTIYIALPTYTPLKNKPPTPQPRAVTT